MSTTDQIAYLEGETGSASSTTTATTTAPSTPATPATPAPATTTSAPPPEKKEENNVRKTRVCVSVIKGEACRTQMEGKHCPYSHEGAPAPETLTRVYICHLPLTYTNDEVLKLTSPYGKIQESRVLVDPRSNLSRGVAFVHYEKHEEAEAAIKAINELKLPNHSTPLAARYARRNRPTGRRGGSRRRRSRSRSPPRRRRYRSPPRRGPGGRRRFRSYDDDYEDDYDYDYYPRRRPYPDEDYDAAGPGDRYAPYGRMQSGGGRSGSGYTTYVPPTVTNTAPTASGSGGGGGGGGGGYGSQSSSNSYGYGSQGASASPTGGRVDGYRSYPQASSYADNGYGAPSGQRY